MKPQVLQSFGAEVEKLALSAALLGRYAARRAAQGVGGAGRLVKSLVKAKGTSRSLGGLDAYALKGVREGGKGVRQAQQKLIHSKGLRGRVNAQYAKGGTSARGYNFGEKPHAGRYTPRQVAELTNAPVALPRKSLRARSVAARNPSRGAETGVPIRQRAAQGREGATGVSPIRQRAQVAQREQSGVRLRGAQIASPLALQRTQMVPRPAPSSIPQPTRSLGSIPRRVAPTRLMAVPQAAAPARRVAKTQIIPSLQQNTQVRRVA